MAYWSYRPYAIMPYCRMAIVPSGDGMHIIAVVAQKGGVGKTTLSQCLAVEALRQGIAAAIVDTDPQKSATEWGSQREEQEIDAPTVLPLGSRPLHEVVKELQDRG